MSLKSITLYVVLVTIVGLIGYDIYAYSQGGQEATISYLVYSASFEHPLIPFSAGVLCGHFFWNLKRKSICPSCGADIYKFKKGLV